MTTTTIWIMPTKEEYEVLSFSLYFLCFLVGLPGNILALCFFVKKRQDLANVIYIFIASFDILISVLMLPLSIPYLQNNQRYSVLFSSGGWFCTLWGMLWFSGSFMTIFLVAVVSVTRCICIALPLARLFLKKSVVIGVILAYLAFLIIQSTIPFWVGGEYQYFRDNNGICMWPLKDLADYPLAMSVSLHLFLCQQIGWFLPIIISSLVTVCVLRKPRSQMSHKNYDVTVSIICFTILCTACNIPPFFYQIIVKMSKLDKYAFTFDSFFFSPYFSNFSVGLSIGVNSALNPLLYYWRTKAFRKFILNKLVELRSLHKKKKDAERRITVTPAGQRRYQRCSRSEYRLTGVTTLTVPYHGPYSRSFGSPGSRSPGSRSPGSNSPFRPRNLRHLNPGSRSPSPNVRHPVARHGNDTSLV